MSPRSTRSALSTWFYLAALSAAIAGWLYTIDVPLVDPLSGYGYWLGVAGATMMLVLLLYPLRKRIQLLSFLGATRHWFRLHMFFGVLGPLLILFHCNFRPGSINSTLALVCTLVVALSGLIGKYVYGKIYADLNGHKLRLADLVDSSIDEQEGDCEMARILLQVQASIRDLHQEVLETVEGDSVSTLRLVWERLRIAVAGRGIVRLIGPMLEETDSLSKAERRALRRRAARFVRCNIAAIRRMCELSLYERVFGIWHIFHLPFFYMLVVTALVHVLAVHMY